MRRHLEEFPWSGDGLSRTERRVLDALQPAPLSLGELLVAVQEEPRFLADTVLAWHLERMAEEGLVERATSQRWISTGKPRRRRLPRWLGGCEVKDESLRWDPALARLVP